MQLDGIHHITAITADAPGNVEFYVGTLGLRLGMAPGGAMRMSELADRVLLSRSGLTRLVDRLEKSGLVERRECEEDARGLLAVITEPGRELFETARGTHLAGVRRLYLARLSDSEQATLGELFERLLAVS